MKLTNEERAELLKQNSNEYHKMMNMDAGELPGRLTEGNNVDAMSVQRQLLYSEIPKVEEAHKTCSANIANVLSILQEEQGRTKEKRVTKARLEKEILELQGYLENETYQRNSVGKQIDTMRKLSTNIGDSTVLNDSSLEICMISKQNAIEAIKKQDIKLSENLLQMQEMLDNKESEVTTLHETLLNQREIYTSNLKACDDEQLTVSQKLKKASKELELLNNGFVELDRTNQSYLLKIGVAEEENKQLESELQDKQQQMNELLKDMEEQQRHFELDYENLTMKLEDVHSEIQTKENAIATLERAIKNQQSHNVSLKEKLQAQEDQNIQLQSQNEELENLQNSSRTQFAENEAALQDAIASKRVELNQLEAAYAESSSALADTAQDLETAMKMSNELMQQLSQYEVLVGQLKARQDVVLQDLVSVEEQLLSETSKQVDVSKEFDEWQAKSQAHELEATDTLSNLNNELNATLAETEKFRNEEQETAKSIYQDMNSIKTDFDIETAQQTSSYQEQQSKFEAEIQKTEKEQQEVLTLQVLCDNECKKVNEECDDFRQKIKHFEHLNSILANISALEEQMPAPSPMQTQVSSRSQLPLSLPGPKKDRDFDNLSGSSVEGHTTNFNQLLQYRRAKLHRRQMKERRKLQSKKLDAEKSSIPPEKNV